MGMIPMLYLKSYRDNSLPQLLIYAIGRALNSVSGAALLSIYAVIGQLSKLDFGIHHVAFYIYTEINEVELDQTTLFLADHDPFLLRSVKADPYTIMAYVCIYI